MDENGNNRPTDWYVLHTLTGQEQKVQKSILSRVKSEEMGEYIGDAVIPVERVSEVRNGKKITATRKIFPGYVLVQLKLYDKRREFLEPTWRFLRSINGFLGFVGGDKPVPLTPEEVENIINPNGESEADARKAKPKVKYDPGETVKIIDGPFMSFCGTVDEVDPEHGKLKVSVAIFGRSAPVELEYWQVERYVEETPKQ